MEYDQRPPSLPTLRETVEPYFADEPGPVAKVSISLPEPLLEAVREVAAATGRSVSGVIAASLRRALDEVEQARLDAALVADRDENLAWSAATAPESARLLSELEW